MKLTELQKRFVDEYLIDPSNARAAYIRAGYKATGHGADVNASRLLADPRIQEYKQLRMQDRMKRTEITQDMVLQRWTDIALADPNELIHYRRVCCRYCFGINHAFQWADEAEYQRAVQKAKDTVKKGKQLVLPTNDGGYGFDRTIRPHPKCPDCRGEGHGEVLTADTRDLSPQAKTLYAGLKQTQNGFEIKMHDQDKALENIARHLGMFVDKVEHSGKMELGIERMSDDELHRGIAATVQAINDLQARIGTPTQAQPAAILQSSREAGEFSSEP